MNTDITTAGNVPPATIAEITAFLTTIRPEGYCTLVAINNEGVILGQTWHMPTQVNEAVAWAIAYNQQRFNLYFTVLATKVGVSTKPSKENIVDQCDRVWTDIDPDLEGAGGYDAAREKLMNGILGGLVTDTKPLVVDTGNGLAAYWFLNEPVSQERCEHINRQLQKQFNGDAVSDCCRIMRLPGTWNYPSDTKLQKGYPAEPTWARVLEWECGTYDAQGLSDWLPAVEVAPPVEDVPARQEATSVAEVREILGHLDPNMERDEWLKVGMGLWHNFSGSEEGFQLLVEWSQSGEVEYSESMMRKEWNSYSHREGQRVVTFSTVANMAKDAGADVGEISRRHRAAAVFGGQVPAPPAQASPVAQWLAAEIGRGLQLDILNAGREVPLVVDVNVIQSMISRAWWSGQKSKVFMITLDETLSQFKEDEALAHLTTACGRIIDYGGLEEALHAAAARDQSLNATERRNFVRAGMGTVQRVILHHLKHYQQRDYVEVRVDMFAARSWLSIGKRKVQVQLIHTPLTVNMDYWNDDVVEDFKQHFPALDMFLDFLVGARFASNGKKAYFWLHCDSDWGKGILFNNMSKDELVTKTNKEEVKKMIEGSPVGKSDMNFIDSLALWMDEFKSVNNEMKELDGSIVISPKNMLQMHVPLYAKVFTSAEYVDSLVGEHGPERQFANRFSYYRGLGSIEDRALWREVGPLEYTQAVYAYMRQGINHRVAWYVEQGERQAAKVADNVLVGIHAQYGLERTFTTLNDNLGDVAIQVIEWLFDQYWHSYGDHKVRSNLIQCQDTGEWHLTNAGTVIQKWINEDVSHSEKGKVSDRKSELYQRMSSDGKGVYPHTFHEAGKTKRQQRAIRLNLTGLPHLTVGVGKPETQ